MARPGPVKQLVAAIESLQSLGNSGEPLDALKAARRIRQAAEDLERLKVQEAREKGISWREIGSLYDISKQAAYQRFGMGVPSPEAVLTAGDVPRPQRLRASKSAKTR